jgi:hypothetical protein
MRTWPGRPTRYIRRKQSDPDEELDHLWALYECLRTQQQLNTKNLCLLHEPEVVCISEGKARGRYEFGKKIAVAMTNRHNWIVGVRLCEDNPYLGHTLSAMLDTVRSIRGHRGSHAYVNRVSQPW